MFDHDQHGGPPTPSTPDPTTQPPPAERLFDRLMDWVDRRRAILLGFGALFQVFFLLAMVAYASRPYLHPESHTVLLRVVPVDPRDLLRGDYVTLGYEVSRPGGSLPEPGQPVYVALKPEEDGRYYVTDEVGATPPPEGTIYLRGTVQPGNRVTYGIESYYVQEGQGHDYENAVRERRLSAEVVIAPDGSPALRGLIIE